MKRILQNNLFMLRYMWKYAKGNVLARFFTILLAPVQPFVFIICMKFSIDGIADGKPLSYILSIIAIAFIASTVAALINAFITGSSSKARVRVKKGVQDELLTKILSIDIACFDDAAFYDKYVRALDEAENRADAVLDSIVGILSSLVSLVTVISIAITLNPLVIAIAAASVALQTLLNIVRDPIDYKRQMDFTRPRRECNYAKGIFYNQQYAQELRMGKLGPLMKRKFNSAMDTYLGIVKKYCPVFIVFDSALPVVGFGTMTGVMAFSAVQIAKGALTIGDFAALLNASNEIVGNMFSLFGKIPALRQNSMYIENLRSVIEYKSTIVSTRNLPASMAANNTLTLKNITFAYPGKQEPTLKNLSMEIRHGSKTAIVGYNGAGKSTIVKLLLRLYDPVAGTIALNSLDYRAIDVASLRNKFGVIFQNYKSYAMTVGENVLLEEFRSKEQEERIIEALDYAGVYDKIAGLEKGVHTALSREFDSDGILLSGGEEQKIAIARAFVDNRDILILDEPSSALDPMAEYEINQKIQNIANGKTVIFISHRLSTVRMADMIYMIDKGAVIEAGSHQELMALKGKYCEMFTAQAKNYYIDDQDAH
ncbi:MAG: ABC transporter ATP-binding protein/permease [Treponema sp.]|jgi:ATP-binding cassette subfamily B protein|nr:ABC transporter ATP-binding protein/permease [Treponema sp.]